MSNLRIFCLAVAVAFWPLLIWSVGAWKSAEIHGPAMVSVGLFLFLILLSWVGMAAIGLFGDRE